MCMHMCIRTDLLSISGWRKTVTGGSGGGRERSRVVDSGGEWWRVVDSSGSEAHMRGNTEMPMSSAAYAG